MIAVNPTSSVPYCISFKRLPRFMALLAKVALGASVAASLLLTGCASLPSDVDRPVSTALTDNSDTMLGRTVAARAALAGTRNDSGFAIVSSAEMAFTSRMALIKAAQKTLDIQYYAIFADDTTVRMFQALREAAARGVRIRVLLDDFNTSGNNARVLQLGFEKNIELRLFNPLPGGRSSLFFRIIGNLKDIKGMQRRMHNKMFVADNAVAIVGGRNLGESYFGQSDGVNFVDLDVQAAGRVARDLSRSFDQYWNNPLAYPVQSLVTRDEMQAVLDSPVIRPSGDSSKTATQASPEQNSPATVMTQVGSGSATSIVSTVIGSTTDRVVATANGGTTTLPALPDSTDVHLLTWTWAPSILLVDKPSKIAADADAVEAAQDTTVDGLLQLTQQAKTNLLIVSPYFVPGAAMMKQFADLRGRGVRVRILTNSLASNDAPAAHVGYARYREALLALGVEIYEMRAEQRGTIRGLRAARSGSGGGGAGSAGGARASLHAKVVVIDERLLVVGSMNLDLRSKLQNSEVAVVVNNPALAHEVTQLIEPTLATGAYRVELLPNAQTGSQGQLVWRAPMGSQLNDSTIEPDASASLKLLTTLIGPFAPDEML